MYALLSYYPSMHSSIQISMSRKKSSGIVSAMK